MEGVFTGLSVGSIRQWTALLFFILGLIFGAGGVVGLFRFPDPYSRLQSGSLAGTTAVVSFFIGALLLSPDVAFAARIIIIIVFFLLSSPTGAHIVARFTWNSDVPPWKPSGRKRSGDDSTDGSRRRKR
jgi:multicomponent Na+:H+ antiporter subunit G